MQEQVQYKELMHAFICVHLRNLREMYLQLISWIGLISAHHVYRTQNLISISYSYQIRTCREMSFEN